MSEIFKLSDICISPHHALTVDHVCRHVYDGRRAGRGRLVVLDVGAGTGRVAEEMVNRGFQLIDGLESSQYKLEVAKKRSLYDNYYNCNIRSSLPIKNAMYDVVVSAEGFGDGGIPCEALHELARVTKPGGLVVLTLKEEHLYTNGQYQDLLEPTLMALQTEGHWELVSRTVAPYYDNNKTGLVFVFKKC